MPLNPHRSNYKIRPKFSHVYQFKIQLQGIEPAIWRRIQVPEFYSFWDLHVAIQDAMGWLDYHLHEFTLINFRSGEKEVIGIPDDEQLLDYTTLTGWNLYLKDYFSEGYRQIDYLYDFGDKWRLCVEYEAIFFKNDKQKYPICLAGERAAPLEDCGGALGYERILEILKNPKREEYRDTIAWTGKKYDPEQFAAHKVRFDDPQKRWKAAFCSDDVKSHGVS